MSSNRKFLDKLNINTGPPTMTDPIGTSINLLIFSLSLILIPKKYNRTDHPEMKTQKHK